MAHHRIQASHEHLALMDDLKAAIANHPALSPLEMLAITAQLVGNLIAFQDQTTCTPAIIMEVVRWNISEGNVQAINGLRDTKGNA